MAADGVFRHAIGRDAFARLGDAVFCDADDKEKIRSCEAAKSGAVVDDVVVGESLLGEDFFEVAATHQRDAIGFHDSCFSNRFHHFQTA